MWGRARAAAAKTLARNVEVFEQDGYRRAPGGAALDAHLEREGERALRLRMAQVGRIFGGRYELEVAPVQPVLPASAGLRARGRGVVRLSRVSFRPRRGDPRGMSVARRLDGDPGVQRALAAVHFQQVRVEPEGRPVVRHVGGCVVWVLFPPFVRAVPLVRDQARATVRALEALAAAGEAGSRGGEDGSP